MSVLTEGVKAIYARKRRRLLDDDGGMRLFFQGNYTIRRYDEIEARAIAEAVPVTPATNVRSVSVLYDGNYTNVDTGNILADSRRAGSRTPMGSRIGKDELQVARDLLRMGEIDAALHLANLSEEY